MLASALRLIHRALGLTLARAVQRRMVAEGVPVTPEQREQMARRLHREVVARRRRSYAAAVEQIRKFDADLTPADPDPYPVEAVVAALERAVSSPAAPEREPDETAEQSVPDGERDQQETRQVGDDSVGEPEAQPGARARVSAPESQPRRRARVTTPAELDRTTRRRARARVIAPTAENRTSAAVVRQVSERASATLARHVAAAGRQAITRTAYNADTEVGWARVLSGTENCAFCAMLASRGPVYRSDKSALVVGGGGGRVRGSREAGERFHDNCDCEVVLVRKGQDWEGREDFERLQRLWTAATMAAGLLREEPRRTFNRAFRRIEQDPALGEEVERLWADATEGLTGSAALDSVSRALREGLPGALTAPRGRRDAQDGKSRARGDGTARAVPRAESFAEIAARHLPGLRASLERLRALGEPEDSPAVQYHRRMIAKFEADLK
ncbi:hypothetical protein [Nocardia farcinica]|uniref:VG15 protein n=1 Tax=Nocardia farcinica TaxID=37329 RepID=UPI0024566358|nr:hypothetical protein [Nocardia farcinica]